MMSAPARAWFSACSTRIATVSSLRMVRRPSAVMAVAGIGVERDVGDQAELRNRLLDRAAGAADEISGIERLGADGVAQRRVGIGKQSEGRESTNSAALRAAPPPGRPTGARRRAWRRPACGHFRLRPRRSARSGRRSSARSRARAAAPIPPCDCGGGGGSGRGRSRAKGGARQSFSGSKGFATHSIYGEPGEKFCRER